MSDCHACSRPVSDANLCRSCLDQLTIELRALIGGSNPVILPKKAGEQRTIAANRGLIAELEDTLTRQARTGQRNGGRSAETPMAYHLGASVDLETIRDGLGFWARTIATTRGITVDAARHPAELAAWLLRWSGEIAQHADAAELHGDVLAMTNAARRTIDRAADLRFVGPCDGHKASDLPANSTCGEDLYVTMHAREAVCRTEDCKAVYPIEERRAWLLEQAVDQLRTARQLAYELPWIAGITVNVKVIGMWAARGKITKLLPHHADPDQITRFRVGEVIEYARSLAEETASRQANGAA